MLAAAVLPVHADDSVMIDRSGNPFMQEVAPSLETEAVGGEALYGAYSCFYHHQYACFLYSNTV